MRLAFLCSSLEPGRDGVGDYSRRLAGEFIRRNHPTIAIGLNDGHVAQATVAEQEIEGVRVPTLRLPFEMPWKQRAAEVRSRLAAHDPDWISLQFVPFGFHPRGLCFGLGKSLAAMNTNAAWHVMFHELWLGLGKDSPVKVRVWGALQRSIASDFMRRLKPRMVHTQAEPYRLALDRLKIKAAILPLFGNIPITPGDGWNGILKPLITEVAGAPPERHELYLAGILGGVHQEWNAVQAVNTMLPLVRRSKKQLVLVFHGKNNLSPAAFQKLKAALQGHALVVTTGERSSRDISLILQTLDLGLATTPLEVIQKSGSAVAMLEHGLPLLVIRDDWHLRGATPPATVTPRLFTPEQFAALENLPLRTPVEAGDSGLQNVATQMLAALNPHLDKKASTGLSQAVEAGA